MTQTPARRRASANYHAKLRDAGKVKMTFWLSIEHQVTMAALAKIHGSQQAAFEFALGAAAREMTKP